MAQLTIQNAAVSGLTPAYGAVSASDKFANPSDKRTYLHVKNGGGSSVTVTITRQNTSLSVAGEGNITLANQTVAIPAGSERIIGPFPESFNDVDGNVVVGYSGTTSVTAAAVRLPPI